ncbi:MAG: KPN_02809 family neutral zinc metallopeptidase [Chitinophagaceae bacterium]
MLWQGRRESSNIEDVRGSGGGLAIGGGLGSLIIGLIIYLLGGNPSAVLNNNNFSDPSQQQTQSNPADDETKQFVAVVLADTEDVWTKLFNDMNKQYIPPKLVLFSQAVQSGCGSASAATGPFYCPQDQKVYLDMSFFQEMKDRFNAASNTPGDFAEAYVIAHEVGHHVQNLLGITDKVDAMRGRLSEKEQNAISVKVELQADFLAGIWAHYDEQMKNILQPGDIESALNAANAIGDDRLQKESQGYVVPDAFTHGTSAQRMYWFKKGYETGDISQGDTFNAPDLNQ